MISELTEKIKAFRDERNWVQFHSPRNLAAAISVEAGELLEHFMWDGTALESSRDAISQEVADVAIYLFELADNMGIDIHEAILQKLEINANKYPIAKARGSSCKACDL